MARRNQNKERIHTLLLSIENPISAQDLYVELRRLDQPVGLATIYRALEGLKLDGKVQVRTLTSGESLYSANHNDRHHLTCLQCGTSIPIEECPVHALEQQLQQHYKFRIFYHTLEFFGLCDRCEEA
jgi:Fur family transcriptional regulator, ferric uptake regulator